MMLGLCDAIYQLAMANDIHWYGHTLRMSFHFVLKSQREAEKEMEETS